MSLKLEEKKKNLKIFRTKHSKFSKECEKSVNCISSEELYNESTIRTYVRRLNLLKDIHHLTYMQIANALETSHTIVERVLPSVPADVFSTEFKTNIKRIDKYYLELFSLYFGVSPIFLIGLTDYPSQYELDGEILSFGSMNEQEEFLAKAIVINLFTDYTKRKLLWDIVKICDARIDWLITIKKSLLSAPNIKKFSLKKFVFDVHDMWDEFMIENSDHKDILDKCVMVIGRLFMVDYDLLNVFAHISLSSELTVIVHNWLHAGGFLSKSKVFCADYTLQNVSDNIFNIIIIDKPFKYDKYLF